jgi:hypothetical protein
VTYIFGQYPTLFSLLSALVAGIFMYRYLMTGKRYALVQTICCTAITVALHHFTAVFFLPFLYVTLFTTSIIQHREEQRIFVKRILIIIKLHSGCFFGIELYKHLFPRFLAIVYS